MHWKETVIKTIKFKKPVLKNIKDGKLDIDIHIPLTPWLETQAKLSFAQGILAALQVSTHEWAGKKVDSSDINDFLRQCGLENIADELEKRKG